MKINQFLPVCLLFSLIAFIGCGSEPAVEEDKNSVNIDYTTTDDAGNKSSGEINIDLDKPQAALDEISKALEGVKFTTGDGEEIEIVNFRELKKMLPESLNGMEKTSSEGQTTGFGGMKVSIAEAEYKEGNQRIHFTLTDTGGLGAALMGMAFWQNMEMDKEDDNGFERTGEIDGNKAYMQYNRKTGKSQIAMIYNNRFLAAAEGNNIDFADLERAVKGFDFGGLE